MNLKEKNVSNIYGNLKIFSIYTNEKGEKERSLLLNKKISNKTIKNNNQKIGQLND